MNPLRVNVGQKTSDIIEGPGRRAVPPWLAAATGLALAPLAAAQEPAGVEEVVVSAQRREQGVQSVPIAVTAFRAEDLEANGFTDPSSISSQTPSLQIKGSNGQSKPNVFLRGVGTNDFNATASSAVGFYTDEVYLGLPSAQLFQMFDLERVEVLRGPQGTLYGRNTTGGAINFLARKPGDAFDFDAGVTYGQYGRLDLEAGVDLVASGKLATRLAGVFRSSDGDMRNLATGEDVRQFDTWAVRSLTEWLPSGNQTWLLNLHAGGHEGDGPRYNFIRADNFQYPDPVLPLIGAQDPYEPPQDFWSGHWDLAGDEDIESFGVALTGTFAVGGATLTSISAYETVEALALFDSDASPLNFVNVLFSDENWQFSQELRLTSSAAGRFTWIGGLYFYRDRIETDNNFDIARFERELFGMGPDLGNPAAPLQIVQRYDQQTSSFAAFGSTTWQISEPLKLTLGLRWTRDSKEIDYHTFVDEAASIGVIPLIDVALEDDWSDVTGNLILDYQVSDDALLYTSFNRGFKSGAYNGSPFFDASAVRAVDPEYVNAIEVGAKTRWADRRVTLNLAAFINDYEDMQVFRFTPDPVTGIPTALLQNAASAEIKGIEVELTARPVSSLEFQLGISRLDANYDRFIFTPDDPATPANEEVDFSGNQLVAAPEWTVNASMQYSIPLGDRFVLTPRFDVTWLDDVFFDASNDPLLAQKAYSVMNASVRLEGGGGRYSATAWIRNLGDETYYTDILDLSDFGMNGGLKGERRAYGITFRYGL